MTTNDKKQQGRLSANFFSSFGTGRFLALSFCTLLLFSCGGSGDDDPDAPDIPPVISNNTNINDANATYGYGTFYIADASNSSIKLYVNRALYIGNKKYESGDKINVGDEVIICGRVVNYNGSTSATVQNKAYIYSLIGKASSSSSTTTANGDGTIDNPYNVAAASKYISTLTANAQSNKDIYIKGVVTSITEGYGTSHPEYARLEFPKLKDGNNLVIIHKDGSEVNYSLEWDCDKLSQRWTCYQLYRSNLQQNTSRWYANEGETQYPQDPDLPSQYRLDQDYFYGSGYDHGHICPSADRLKSITSNKQTFYLTNMQPMVEGFNAKVWANMEAAVRNFAKKNNYGICDTLYVCKGGTIDSESNIITRIAGKLIVPKYYFMALLAVKNGTYHAAGLWIEHKASNDENLAKYAVTIDELEEKTGIDFFCNLPDDKEKTVESTAVATSYWGFQ